MKGITLITVGKISDKAKVKLRRMMERRTKRLERLADDYRSGRLRFHK